jgi:lipopolysaccharide biosynthesis protein
MWVRVDAIGAGTDAETQTAETWQAISEGIVAAAGGTAGAIPFERAGLRARRGTRIGSRRVKLVAFYLPQFHPIPLNDRAWGRGFTEWNQITKARPLYRGHRQPRLPLDMGFYDLRVPETRAAQAHLAQRFGIHGFCYYYYWFDGQRLLERPLEDVITSGEPDMPFCICWANESWSRRWDGLEHDLLVEQRYSEDSSRRFIRDVIPMLRDPRYIRFNGKPVLLVYRARHIPNISEALAIWRSECRRAGIGEIHLCGVRFWDIVDVQSLGFDAAVDFPPQHVAVRNVTGSLPGLVRSFTGMAYDYQHVVRSNLDTMGHGYEQPVHRGVMLAWDNTPRLGEAAHLAHGATPELYQEWLEGVLEQDLAHSPGDESIVFINAWNEWAEGANLEPDSEFGFGFLNATADAVERVRERHPTAASAPNS